MKRHHVTGLGIFVAAIMLVATGRALAQRPGGVGRGGGRPGGMPNDQFPGSYRNSLPGTRSNDADTHSPGSGGPPPGISGGTGSSMRAGLQLGPPGRWWDDKHFAKSLGLRPDQQRHMDSIFEGSRSTLLKRYQDLQDEEQRMETLTHAHTLDENALFSQIDRVAQARADLEKANTHLLYQIREEMDGDQIAKLEQHR